MKIMTIDGQVWYPTFYDLDTVLGIDNSGYLTIEPDVEIESGSYNTSNSNLWSKVWNFFNTELKEEWAKMRQGSFTLDNLMNYIYGEQISKIPAKLYNDDAQVKYLEFGSLYTYCCHGSKEHQIRRWLRERIAYVDSMLGYFTSQEDQVTIRMNKTGEVSFEVTPYIPIYFSVKWSNATGGTQTFKLKRGETKTFSYSSTTSTDQEVLIYHAKYIKRLDNLSNLNPSSCILSNATKLTNVEIHSSKLYNINVTNNKFLRSINLENCTALGTVTATGSSLNLSNCKYLRYCNVYNTNLTEVQLNTSGGSLTEIYYPKSIQSINLVKQRLLELIGLPYGEGGSEIPTSLYTISIQDCPSITKLNTSSDTTIAGSFASMVYVNNLTIRNSLDLASLKFDGFHRLQNVTIENMYNLEEVGFNNLLPVGETSTIKYIGMSNCPKLGTIELNCTSNDYEITFADDAILNFGGLFKLNSITSNCVLKGIKTIVVPINLESMFFTNEYGSGYSTIENIWVSSQCNVDTQATTPIVTHVDSTYSGIDFLGMNLKNIDLGALVNIPKAINFKLSPTTVNPHFNLNRDGETYKYLQPIGTLDLSNYTESLAKFFDGVDLDKLEIICNNNLPQTDLSYCFYNSSFSTNDAINKLLTKVSSITNLDYCFYRTTIDSVDILDEINMGASSSMNYTFAECPNIKTLNNVVIPSTVTSVEGMFNKCPLTTITNMIVNVRGSISGLFKGCNKLTTITTLRIPNVTDISNTFDGCNSLSSLSGFELPSSCTNVSNLFNGCYMLTELSMEFGTNITAGDNWYPPNLETLHDTTISNDYVKLTNCTTLKTLNNVNISGGDLSDLFNGCTNLANINRCTFNATSSLARAFKGCSKITINPITTIVDTVTDISEMYSGCTGITDISGMTFGSGITNATDWITGSPITTANNITIKSFIDGIPAIMFTNCSTLVSAKNLKLITSLDSVNVTNMFDRCTNLEDINFVDPPRFSDCKYLFSSTSIGKNTNGIVRLYEDLGISVNTIQNSLAWGMFYNNTYIKEFIFPDEEFLNFYGRQLFEECKNLKIIRNLKSKYLGYGNMFRFCKGASDVELINCYISVPFESDGCTQITKLTNCTIPSNITNIDRFFANMNIQNDIEIPSHVTSCVETFKNCTSMTHIHSNWNNSYDKTITSTDCYAGCTGITHVDGENVIYNEYSEGLDEIPETWGGYGFSVNNTAIVVVEIPSDALTFEFNKTYGGLDNILKTSWGDGTSDSNQNIHTYTTSGTYTIKVKYADAAISTNQTILHGNYTPASGNSSLRSAGTKVVQVPIGTQIGMGHFRDWSKLQTVHLDRAILDSQPYIFHGDTALERVDLTNCRINGVGKDTWLKSTKITTINIAGSTITDGEYLFTDATALTTILGLDTADFSSNHKITGMFANCKELLTVPPLRTLLASTAKPEDVWKVYLMCSKVTTIDISGVDFSEATRIRQMFAGDTALTNIIGFNEANLSKITDLWNIFGDTPNLAIPIDLSNLNRSEPVYMAEAFFNCGVTELSGLSGIMLSAHDYSRTFQSMPNIKNLDVSGLDTSRVTRFGTAWSSYIYDCPNVETVDISNLNILGCGAEGSFYDLCRSMGKLKSLVSKNANVSNLTDLTTFLYECPELVDLDLESWDISNVTAQGSFVGKSFKLTNFKSFRNINCNMNFSWFPQLTTESLVSIINALKATTTTKTLTLGSKLLAKLTSEQIKIATDKGWTVV
jgi:surface protein